MILAGIDIGTNTLRLLIARTEGTAFKEIHSDRRVVRLGQGLDRTGSISEDAIDRTISALTDFARTIRLHGVERTAAIGTSALRIAGNAREFIASMKRTAGIDIAVVSGEEEARLTMLGVLYAVGSGSRAGRCVSEQALVIDIGGGSTELIMTGAGCRTEIASLPLGAVYLTERFIKDDPPLHDEIALVREAVRRELDKHERRFAPSPDRAGICIGTAGTITTLASIHLGLAEYDPDRINGTLLTRDAINETAEALSRLAVKERSAIRGLEKGREDIILAGALIAVEIMRRFGYDEMLVSEGGLREGIILDIMHKNPDGRYSDGIMS